METCSCPFSTNSTLAVFRNDFAKVIEIVRHLGFPTCASAVNGGEKQGIGGVVLRWAWLGIQIVAYECTELIKALHKRGVYRESKRLVAEDPIDDILVRERFRLFICKLACEYQVE